MQSDGDCTSSSFYNKCLHWWIKIAGFWWVSQYNLTTWNLNNESNSNIKVGSTSWKKIFFDIFSKLYFFSSSFQFTKELLADQAALCITILTHFQDPIHKWITMMSNSLHIIIELMPSVWKMTFCAIYINKDTVACNTLLVTNVSHNSQSQI